MHTPNAPTEQSEARRKLWAFLAELGITYQNYDHEPIFTVDEGASVKATLPPGGHSKSLFLKDKSGALFLAVALAETRVDLTALSKRVAKGRLSFAKPDLLLEVLGVTPGSVTPFSLMNDQAHRVSPLIDEALMGYDPVYFHPLENTASTAISPENLLSFVRACGHAPRVLDLARP